MRGLKTHEKLVYAFRGWLAFVAFMDLGTAVRCLVEKRMFMDESAIKMALNEENCSAPALALARMHGAYCVMKAAVLIHCSVFIHYKPLISMGIFSLVITLVMHSVECFYFRTASMGFNIIFPVLLNVLTLMGLAVVLPFLDNYDDPAQTAEEENTEILRAVLRRRKMHKRNS